MCRFVAYLGKDTLLQDILVKPQNSIVMQSLHARETTLRTNGDGFGLGWYTPEINTKPALFKSVLPAWNDTNLLHLTAKIQSPCFFAHVRAASAGGVSTDNCHPFIFGDWMLMHNGEIYDFIEIKRHIRHLLDDDLYHWINGDTDSEHIFALFLQLAKNRDLNQLAVVAEVLQETFNTIKQLIARYGKKGPSYYNICLTDGQRLIASRYCTYPSRKALTLHYFIGSLGKKETNDWRNHVKKASFIVVSSERLNGLQNEWVDVPEQHIVLIDKDKSVVLKPITE